MKKYFLFISCCLLLQETYAQHKLREHLDSLSAFKVQYYYENRKDVLYGLDTGITNLEEYNFIQRKENEYLNLGNMGSEAYPIKFEPLHNPGFSNGLRQYDLYWLHLDDIKYYDLKRPFSELTMNLGLKQELNFRGTHSQNIGDRFNFGIYFNRNQSKGYFQRQQNIGNNVSVYANYLTKNKKFRTIAAFAINSFKSQQNGGIVNDYINDTNQIPYTKELLEVHLQTASSNYRDLFGKVNQAYEIGYKFDKRINDTLIEKAYQPLFSLNYEFGLGRNRFDYKDKSTTLDSAYYNEFFFRNPYTLKINDTLANSLRYAKITNQIAFQFLGYKKVKGQEGKPINLMAGVSLIHENFELKQNFYEQTFNNLSVKGYVRSNELAHKKWNYTAAAQFFLAGYNLGDLDIRGGIHYDFKKLGILFINGIWSRQAPAWIENHYHNSTNSWNNNYKKTNTIEFNAGYVIRPINKKLKIYAKAEVNYYLVNNYIYWNLNSKPIQLSNVLNVFNAAIQFNLSYGHIHFDNYAMLQRSNRSDVIQFPTWFVKSSLYYENYVFKRAMLAQVGVDMRYWSNYNANNYNPLIGQFFLQDQLTMSNLPVLDLFINLKIRTVRIFLKGNNLLEGVGSKGYYTGYLYPADQRSFKLGVTWRFLD